MTSSWFVGKVGKVRLLTQGQRGVRGSDFVVLRGRGSPFNLLRSPFNGKEIFQLQSKVSVGPNPKP
jgi:hypothetical protein